MIPVAVVLVVLVIVFTVAIIIGNPQSFDLQIFVARIPANITGVYVTGAVTMLVLAVAGWLLWTGLVRLRAQQKEIKALKAAAGVRGKALPGKGGSATGSGTKDVKDPKDTAGATAKDDATGKTAESKTSDHDRGAKKPEADPTEDSPGSRGASPRGSALDLDEPAGRGPAGAGREPGDGASATKDRTGRRDRPEDGETTAEERRRLLDEADDLTRDDPRS
ncbi:hypothetical protein [Microlunatus parietis]|uniref:Lipopolysaccharide assembly protein A domain-containing protein n=1 Tax=Microlunatus parietis TaxID=682979 RepID=A0A7Y9L9B1_9ACTN|nr:hypothetical protein [Microlunatus parietis]NYE71609.1 hypothetical protein [Microlunatus parietis]